MERKRKDVGLCSNSQALINNFYPSRKGIIFQKSFIINDQNYQFFSVD